MEEKANLSDYMIAKFYKNVVIRFENEIKNPYVDDKNNLHKHRHEPISLISGDQTNEIIQRFGIKIVAKVKGQIEEDIKENTIHQVIKLPEGKDKNNEKRYTYYSLITHLRNSFAHANIKKQDNYYVFKDYNDKGEITMIAKIKNNKFFRYIDAIYEESKKHKEINND